MMNESALIKLNIEYDVELSHLTTLSASDLIKWFMTSASSPQEALDNLYKQHPINQKFLI